MGANAESKGNDTQPTTNRRQRARQSVRFGLVTLVVAAPMVLAPAWLGRGKPSACVAGFGFVAACLGLNCMIQGGWDLLRGKRGGKFE